MRYGVTMFVTDVSIGMVDLAKAVDERGLDSVWLPEHTHIPTSRRTPYPNGGDLPDEYRRCLDPFVGLMAAAMAVPRLRVGTGILLVAQHDPIVAAKAAATVDLLSNGRLTLGVGFGWNEDEMNDHGVDYRTRRANAREHVLAMRELWTKDEASFDGEYVHFDSTWQWPKPVQPNGPPVLIGGAAGPKLFEHIAEYADGWIPIGGKGITNALPRLRDAVASHGRDPADLEIVPFGSIPDPGKLDYFESIGVTECVFALPSAPAEQVLPLLDKQAAIVAEHRVVRLCFVCWGNICRSPAAEATMRRLVDDAGLSDHITVDSAGTSSEHLGEPPDRRTIKEARRRGLDVESHRVWRFATEDFDRFDLVLVVDRVNEQRLLNRGHTSGQRAKVQLLRSFVPDDMYDQEVPDPWYGSDKDFILTFDLVEEACVALLEQLRCQLPS